MRPATSHKYGCSTILKPTANLNDPNWTTTTRLTFRKPEDRTKPNSRVKSACANVMFDSQMVRSTRPDTKASGFVQNSTLYDGTGWAPDAHLHTDQIRTSYRNGFCKPKPFHKASLQTSPPKLRRKQQVYDKKDFRKIKFPGSTVGHNNFNPYFD